MQLARQHRQRPRPVRTHRIRAHHPQPPGSRLLRQAPSAAPQPGKDVKFEDVKPFVQEVYGERLREAIIANYKSRSKIEIHAAK